MLALQCPSGIGASRVESWLRRLGGGHTVCVCCGMCDHSLAFDLVDIIETIVPFEVVFVSILSFISRIFCTA